MAGEKDNTMHGMFIRLVDPGFWSSRIFPLRCENLADHGRRNKVKVKRACATLGQRNECGLTIAPLFQLLWFLSLDKYPRVEWLFATS